MEVEMGCVGVKGARWRLMHRLVILIFFNLKNKLYFVLEISVFVFL